MSTGVACHCLLRHATIVEFKSSSTDLVVLSEPLQKVCQSHQDPLLFPPLNLSRSLPAGNVLLLLLLLLLSRFSRVRLCETPETAAHQAPPSLGFSR